MTGQKPENGFFFVHSIFWKHKSALFRNQKRMITVHIFVAILTIFFVWKKKVYKNWEKYHPTMLYFSVGNLTYNLLCAKYLLWKVEGSELFTHTLLELLYTFITFPGTALLFLGNYPEKMSIAKKII
jgi:predicted ferric reductase